MSADIRQIPYPNSKCRQTTIIPSNLIDMRLSISASNQLMNSINNLHNYIESLFTFTKEKSPRKDSRNLDMGKLLDYSKSIIMFQDQDINNVWINYQSSPYNKKDKGNNKVRIGNWTVYDETVVSVISLSFIYNALTTVELSNNYETNGESEEFWKKSSNYLKCSISILIEFKKYIAGREHDPIDGQMFNHFNKFNYVYHLNNSLIQLISVFKNIFMTINEIDLSFDNFDKLPSKLLIYIKIIIFIYNEFSILEKIDASGDGNRSGNENVVDVLKSYLEIIFCYYLSLDYYNKNQIGISISLINYALVNSIDQDPIKNKLKLNFMKKNNNHNNNNNNNKQLRLRDKLLFREDIRLLKKYGDNGLLPLIFKKNLINLLRVLRILNLKFEKQNDSLDFDSIKPYNDIKLNYLFNSNNLPNGLQIPLDNLPKYLPNCISNEMRLSDTHNYF